MALWTLVPLLVLVAIDGALLMNRLDSFEGSTPGGGDDATTWLLIGSDRREDIPEADVGRFGSPAEVPGERADVIIALRVADDGAVSSLGISRDLSLVQRGAAPDRLATALARGPMAIAGSLCDSLGLGVDHVAMIDFDGLRKLVDLAGGITVTSDSVVADFSSGLLLDAGPNKMDGSHALAYVRARQIQVWVDDQWVPDPTRSAERSLRALQVIRKLGSELDLNWANPVATQRLAWTGTGALSVDGGTGPFDLLSLFDAAREVDPGNSTTLPSAARQGPAAQAIPTQDPVSETFEAVREFQGGSLPSSCDEPVMQHVAQ